MNKEQKEYKVSKEIAELFNEVLAAKQCRDIAVESIFHARRAIFYGKIYVKNNTTAWNLVRKLYPELNGKLLNYDYYKETLTILGEKVNE